jgi:glutathione S-transferase
MIFEIAGEMGLGWCRRLAGVDAGLRGEGGFAAPIARYLGQKYGWREGCGPEATRRVVEVLGLLSSRLAEQRARGHRYYLGHGLTALDIYSATFTALFKPLPPEHCPMPPAMREAFESLDEETAAALDPAIVEHRDFVYAEHLELPLTL